MSFETFFWSNLKTMGLKAAFEMDTVSCQNSEVRMADQKIMYIVVNTGLRFLSYVDR